MRPLVLRQANMILGMCGIRWIRGINLVEFSGIQQDLGGILGSIGLTPSMSIS